MPDSRFLNKQVVAWALYDWGNSAFALSVLAVLFPLFLGSYWSAGSEGAVVTQRLAWATAGAVTTWLNNGRANQPIYYDYGNNIYYEGDNVYYDGQPISS